MARRRKTPKANVPGADTRTASPAPRHTADASPSMQAEEVSIKGRQMKKTKSNSNIVNAPATLPLPWSIQTMRTEPPTQLGTIGILPPELREIVWKNLTWGASINLAAVNKSYRSFIDPETYTDHADRLSFLKSQERKPRFNSHKTGKSWYGCVGCWRLKSARHFDVKEITKSKKKNGTACWYRRCLQCQLGDDPDCKRRPQLIANGAGKSMRFCVPCHGFRTGRSCTVCRVCLTCSGGPDHCKFCKGQMRSPFEEHFEGQKLFDSADHWPGFPKLVVPMWKLDFEV